MSGKTISSIWEESGDEWDWQQRVIYCTSGILNMPSHMYMIKCQVGYFQNCVMQLRRSSFSLSHFLLKFTLFFPLTLGIIHLNLLSICNSTWVEMDLIQLSY